MDIATHFGPEIARRFGSEKLLALHRYLKATGRDERPGDLLTVKLLIRGADGRWGKVSVVDANAAQVDEAARGLELRRAAAAEASRTKKAERVLRVSRPPVPRRAGGLRLLGGPRGRHGGLHRGAVGGVRG